MGRTPEKVSIQNSLDVYDAALGKLAENAIRTAEVEAIVDTGAAYLCLPPAIVAQLGLRYSRSRFVQTANGRAERKIFAGAQYTIGERTSEMPVMQNDEETPPLIGYLVLQDLDFVVDPNSEKLIPNPEHNGDWITDLL